MKTPPPAPSPFGKEVMAEAGRALDSLSALSVQLTCQHCETPETLVLTARRVAEACATIDEAVASLKHILMIGDETGNGPVPPQMLR
jgi:hypothetical protein